MTPARLQPRLPTASDTGAGRCLPAFLAASVCLHAGLLLAWQHSSPSNFAGSEPPTLSIDLVLAEPVAAAPAPAAKPAQAPRPKRPRPERKIVPVAKQHQRPASAPRQPLAPAAPAAEITHEPIEPGSSPARAAIAAEQSLRARLKALLLTDLARQFEYPTLARRRGWQGMVLLSITVEPDGTLGRVRISQSSGYDVLDRSAVDTLQRIGQLAQAGHWLQGQKLELLLPIVYRLTD